LSDISLRTKSNYIRAWLAFIGFAACLDFAATVLADFFPQQHEIVIIKTGRLLFHRKEQVLVASKDTIVHDMFQFLDMWYVQIGIFFSILWFIHAFVKAQWTRDKKLLELDRKRLLQQNSLATTEWKGAWGAYHFSVVVQLLLLPVGFYLSIWYLLRHVLQLSKNNGEEEVDIVYVDEDGYTEIEQLFTTHSTLSLLFALCSYAGVVMVRITGMTMKDNIRYVIFKAIKRLFRFGVFHPRKFSQRLRTVRTGMRWAKYLAPLVGACNKLLGNVKDLMIKYRQNLQAKWACRIRERLWRHMDDDERQEAAALRVQNVFRAMKARKILQTLQSIQGKKEFIAAIKMQTALRSALSRARVRIIKKRRELKRLYEQALVTKTYDASHMSATDRLRMYQLQDELKVKAKTLVNEKLLLRPNTTFAVYWKVIFVICIIFEISQLALKPKLKEYKNKETGECMNIGEGLDHHFVPAPMSAWEECIPWVADPTKFKKDLSPGPFGALQNRRFRRKDKNVMSRPWYCQELFVTAQSVYIAVLRIVLTQTLVIVGVVCFLDVFVTFFTGELDPDTGALKPKPFFTRWILPGLLLQLLVNPQMEATSGYVFRLVNETLQVGPVRAWRWTVALFYPLSIVLWL
jgi:hypothetical protein